MRSKNLFFLVSHSSAGGAQEIWANLAQGFKEKGDRVTLMALYPLREMVGLTREDLPWKYVVPERPDSVFGALRLLRSFVRLLEREKPDYVLTAMPAANILAALAARLARVRTRVITSHHSPVKTHNPLLNRLDNLTGSLSSVAHVVSVSKTVSNSLERKSLSYRSRCRTIYNALPPHIEQHLDRLGASREGRTSGRTVVATGRLAEQKNYPQLIRAAALMPDVHLKIVGDGPERQALTALAAELKVEDRVEFLGHRPREETLEILATADVFAQVSLFEGHSLALIEASRLGIPIVVSAIPEQIEGVSLDDGRQCGVAVPLDSPEALQQAITDILDHPARRSEWTEKSRMLGRQNSYERTLGAYTELME